MNDQQARKTIPRARTGPDRQVEPTTGEPDELRLPRGLTDNQSAYPTVFINTGMMPLHRASRRVTQRLVSAFHSAFDIVHPGPITGQALIKVHIGEPRCKTRMRPEYVQTSVRFLRSRGAGGIVAGDTTVAYTGPRGHRENPPADVDRYQALAVAHGWSAAGRAGVPFVVLDRPASALPDRFEFDAEQARREVQGVKRFGDFYLAGGFEASDFVMNHAHLTLHGLAGVAGCVKSVAMGCSALTGKLRMHQHLFPQFDEELCVLCGNCAESCPEGALSLPEGAPCPVLEEEKCIGCGECVAVCALSAGAASMQGADIDDWQRGQDTLAERMVDYTVGLMNGKWDTTIHVLHMYSVTALCDCVDERQTPLLRRDIGFLVGKNPFAIDRMASVILAEALLNQGAEADSGLIGSADASATYARDTYNILAQTPVEMILVPRQRHKGSVNSFPAHSQKRETTGGKNAADTT